MKSISFSSNRPRKCSSRRESFRRSRSLDDRLPARVPSLGFEREFGSADTAARALDRTRSSGELRPIMDLVSRVCGMVILISRSQRPRHPCVVPPQMEADVEDSRLRPEKAPPFVLNRSDEQFEVTAFLPHSGYASPCRLVRILSVHLSWPFAFLSALVARRRSVLGQKAGLERPKCRINHVRGLPWRPGEKFQDDEKKQADRRDSSTGLRCQVSFWP